MGETTIGLLSSLLGSETSINEPFLAASCRIKCSLQLTVNTVVKTWNGWEEVRLKN